MKIWSVLHTTNFIAGSSKQRQCRRGRLQLIVFRLAEQSSRHLFNYTQKPSANFMKVWHICWLPHLKWLVAFQSVHGFMHSLCANLNAEQTVLMARSNAFHRLQNGTELMLIAPIASTESSPHQQRALLSAPAFIPSPAPQTLASSTQ